MIFLDSTEHIYFPTGTEQCIVRHRFLEHRVSPRAEEKDASSLSIVSIYTPHLKLLHASFNVNCHCFVHHTQIYCYENIIDKNMYILLKMQSI